MMVSLWLDGSFDYENVSDVTMQYNGTIHYSGIRVLVGTVV